MADVCLTAPSVLSPISPNENRKRRHGYGDAGDGCGGTWFKRYRTGHSFARRLLHLRGFTVDVRQAEELVRFIEQLPQEMDKEVSQILEKCGDIDDAIRQLTSLKLTMATQESVGGNGKAELTTEAPAAPGEAGVASEAAGVAVEASAGAEAVAAESTPPQPPLAEKCVLSQEWVTALVQEMSASADVADAHTRATRVLQAFEAAVRGAVASDGAGAAGADAKAMAENLAKENLILKRAVAIQNARQQEHGQLQQQVAELQRACATYQQELLQAQRTNYSLGLHLKEAMSPSPSTFNRNPDVF